MPNLLPSPLLTLNTNVGGPRLENAAPSYSYSYSYTGMEGHVDAAPSPRTNQEWKKVLFDIKRDYLNRKHRSCASRCRQLLMTAKTHV